MKERPTRRPHRRVHNPRTSCKCPPGSKTISTCKTGETGEAKCRGRRVSCIAQVAVPGYAKPLPRFVPLDCGAEAGPVEQWKAPKGYRSKKKRKAAQLPLMFNRPQATQAHVDLFAPASGGGRNSLFPPFVD